MDNKQTACTNINHYKVNDLKLDISRSECKQIQQDLQQSQGNMAYNNVSFLNNWGQIESKKLSKKLQNTQMQTKGTSMSFGFRKNLNTTPKKLINLIKTNIKSNREQLSSKKLRNDNGNINSETGDNNSATNAANTAESTLSKESKLIEDNNGNSESLKDKSLVANPKSSGLEKGANNDSQLCNKITANEGQTCFGNLGLARSLSTDLSSRMQKNKQKKSNIKTNVNETNNNNNNKKSSKDSKDRNSNCNSSSTSNSNSNSSSSKTGNRVTFAGNLKYRSKSAHIGSLGSKNSRDSAVSNPLKSIRPNSKGSNVDSQNSKHQSQRLQTAPLVLSTRRTTSAPTAYLKFTLHTVHLPKAEYPVPISINIPTSINKTNLLATFAEKAEGSLKDTSTKQRNFYSAMSNAVLQQHRIDAKTTKQIANNSTRRMLCDSREISRDSGIASLEVGLEISNKQRSCRFNHLNVVDKLSEACNLVDSQSKECPTIEPLALPKLPSDNKIIPLPLNGLTRSNTASNQKMHEFPAKKQQEQSNLTATIKERTTTTAGSILASKEHCKEKNDMERKLKSEISPLLGSLIPPTTPASAQSELKLKTDETGTNTCRETNQTPSQNLNTLNNLATLSKFAKMALEGSEYLLEDEPSPTDSLISNTEFEFDTCKQRKQKLNKEFQEKDDELATELDNRGLLSPITPPLHASSSFSFSDCGNLIDDEIADQPALLCHQNSQEDGGEDMLLCKKTCDAPTQIKSIDFFHNYMETGLRDSQCAPVPDTMEFKLLTPLSLRKGLTQCSNSLDSTSPCESICSDDLIMDFDMVSSMDSMDIKSRCVTDLKSLSENEVFRELQPNYFDMKFLTSSKTTTKDNGNNYTLQLPKHAIRLLNRSRLQQEQEKEDQQTSLLQTNYENSKAFDQILSPASSLNNSCSSSLKRHPKPNKYLYYLQQQEGQRRLKPREIRGCSDDLMLYDKSFRNAMIQDVLQFKRQLIHLRNILQEFDILNPFDNHYGQRYVACGFDNNVCSDADIEGLTANNADNQLQQLADIRRQIVYLQGQVDDRDRTIRLQEDVIKQLESNKDKKLNELLLTDTRKECVNTATQTERAHPLSVGIESLNRNNPQCTPYIRLRPTYEDTTTNTTTIVQHHRQNSQHPATASNRCQMHRTIVSTSFKNYNQQFLHHSWMPQSSKSVKITLIGDPAAAYSNTANNFTNSKNAS